MTLNYSEGTAKKAAAVADVSLCLPLSFHEVKEWPRCREGENWVDSGSCSAILGYSAECWRVVVTWPMTSLYKLRASCGLWPASAASRSCLCSGATCTMQDMAPCCTHAKQLQWPLTACNGMLRTSELQLYAAVMSPMLCQG
jgi:hypothetical protein